MWIGKSFFKIKEKREKPTIFIMDQNIRIAIAILDSTLSIDIRG